VGGVARPRADVHSTETEPTHEVPTLPRVDSSLAAATPGWGRWREAHAVIVHPPHLRRTIRIAIVVGSLLFAINHLDTVLRGEATSMLWLKGALTYVVPFCTSNLGVLVASRRHAPSAS
jgi:hypothetical protein